MKRTKKETERQYHARLVDTLTRRAWECGVGGVPLHAHIQLNGKKEDLAIYLVAAMNSMSRELKRLLRERNGLRRKVAYYAPAVKKR